MEHGNQPATKADLAELRTEFKADMAELRTEFKADMAELRSEFKADVAALKQDIEQSRAEFNHGFDDLKETMRDAQTEILKAFYGYTQTADARFKESDGSIVALKQRLSVVEERLLEVEKRLNLPPAA
jgi:Skp family chaperone for outer membrane proteins